MKYTMCSLPSSFKVLLVGRRVQLARCRRFNSKMAAQKRTILAFKIILMLGYVSIRIMQGNSASILKTSWSWTARHLLVFSCLMRRFYTISTDEILSLHRHMAYCFFYFTDIQIAFACVQDRSHAVEPFSHLPIWPSKQKMLRAFTRNTQKLTDRKNSSATKEIIKVNNNVAQHARGNQVPPESG